MTAIDRVPRRDRPVHTRVGWPANPKKFVIATFVSASQPACSSDANDPAEPDERDKRRRRHGRKNDTPFSSDPPGEEDVRPRGPRRGSSEAASD
jgi:hypothetical protein